MNFVPTFLNFLLTLMNRVSSLGYSFHDVIKFQHYATKNIFLHHGEVDCPLLMVSYSRTTNVYFRLIENYVTKPAEFFWVNGA